MLDLDPPATGMPGVRVLFLNGPPRVGKDTAGQAIVKASGSDATIIKFATPLKRMAHAIYNLPTHITPEYFEDAKDTPTPEFFGLSPRQAYIMVSEKIIKPFYGNDIFGRLLIRTLYRRYKYGYTVAVITDSGFAEEAEPVIAAVGAANCKLIRIHGDGRDKTFSGDSRSHIYLSIPSVDVHNDIEGDLTSFKEQILDHI